MSMMNISILALVFLAVFGLAMLSVYFIFPNPVRKRLQAISVDAGVAAAGPDGAWMAKIASLATPFAKLSIPEEGWDKSSLRMRLMNAGYRSEQAQMIYFGAKTFLAITAPVAVWLILFFTNTFLSLNSLLIVLLSASTAGLYLPNLVLARLVSQRQLRIFESFPDALDLMMVSIEAGLSIDAAIARVAAEMRDVAPELSDELYLVTLELRAGNSKEKALNNLAMRTGVDDVQGLVAMLIQAERFGTSVADSLRVHSDTLRTKRRQKAEEAAAKIALKLLFPLIFCVFPALLLVLLGPAFIQIYRVLLPSMAGQ